MHARKTAAIEGCVVAHKLEGVDASWCRQWVVPDGRHVEEDGHHEETQHLQPEAAHVPVVHHHGSQVVSK